MISKIVQSGTMPQDIHILTDKVLVATDILTVSVPADADGETTAMYEFTQTEYTKDEYIAYFSERDRSDIDYIAMMTDIDLEEG